MTRISRNIKDSYLKKYQGVKYKKIRDIFWSSNVSSTIFKSRYGSSHTTDVNKPYIKRL
jgi:hypothetical protein